MSYTLGQAAKATGKDRATISRAIRKGKISAHKDEQGQWAIEPVELHRVYPALQQQATTNDNASATQSDTTALVELAHLRTRLEAAERQIQSLEGDKAFLQSELSKATTLLSDQRPRAATQKPAEGGSGFWRGLFGRKS